MVINPIVGVYIPIIRNPIKRWDDHPKYCDFWPWHIYAHKIPCLSNFGSVSSVWNGITKGRLATPHFQEDTIGGQLLKSGHKNIIIGLCLFFQVIVYFLPWDSSALFTTMDGRNMFVFFFPRTKQSQIKDEAWLLTRGSFFLVQVPSTPLSLSQPAFLKVWAVIGCLWWMWLWQLWIAMALRKSNLDRRTLPERFHSPLGKTKSWQNDSQYEAKGNQWLIVP